MASEKLVELLELQQEQLRQQQEEYRQQEEIHRQELHAMMKVIEGFRQQPATSSESATSVTTAIPKFQPFDSTSELWTDYWKRFQTFSGANSVQESKKAQIFLTNESNTVYKIPTNMASQLSPKKDINELSIDEIVEIM